MPVPVVYLVGADKGGVGKTMVTRALLDYLHANGIEYQAFDTEHPSGALQRFFPEKAQVVDLTTSNDQMKVFDDLASTQATVIDIRAGLLSPTLRVLSDIGFLEAAKANKLRIRVLHVLGPATQSLDEVKPIVAALDGAKHIAVANHIDDTAYAVPEGAINIPRLDGEVAKAIDALAKPFQDFITGPTSFVQRGYARKWLSDVFKQFDAAQLNTV